MAPIFLATVLILAAPQCVLGVITWDAADSVAAGLPDPPGSVSVREWIQVHVSPGGTVFYLWMDGDPQWTDTDPGTPAEFLQCCDGRMAFASNTLCPSYADDPAQYGCSSGPDPYCQPCAEPRACRYYYLPKALSRIYVQPKLPDGTLGAVEMVNPVDPDSLTNTVFYDAAVGPDGSLHVVWEDQVPNVRIEPAPYSNLIGVNAGLPVEGQLALYNQCGRDTDDDGFLTATDRRDWIIGPSDQVCVDSCGAAECDEIDSLLTTCTPTVPCWRQLANLNVICYRRRSPTGTWGQIHRHIAPYTDVYKPEILRTCRTPVIAVDDERWVYVAWDQKALDYPSCAFRRTSQVGYGQSALQSRGAFNMGMYDCFFRRWDSDVFPDGPSELADAPVTCVTPDTLPDEMPQDALEHHMFQDDAPWDIKVVGSGGSAWVHLIVARAPTIGVPCDSANVGWFNDCELYTYLAAGDSVWAPRQQVTKAPKEIHSCGDSCRTGPPGGLEMTLTHFVKNSGASVDVVFGGYHYEKLDSTCVCPYSAECFDNYYSEVFHRCHRSFKTPQLWSGKTPHPRSLKVFEDLLCRRVWNGLSIG